MLNAAVVIFVLAYFQRCFKLRSMRLLFLIGLLSFVFEQYHSTTKVARPSGNFGNKSLILRPDWYHPFLKQGVLDIDIYEAIPLFF